MFGLKLFEQAGSTWGFFYAPNMTRDDGIFVTDENGYIFSEFLKQIAYEHEMEVPAPMLDHSDSAINDYVRNNDLVVVLRDSTGTKTCFSVNYRNKLPDAFTSDLRNYIQLMPEDTILWADDVFKTPQEAPAREVIYGQRVERPPQTQQTSQKPTASLTPAQRFKAAQKWHHPGELSQAEMDYLSGKTKEPPKP